MNVSKLVKQYLEETNNFVNDKLPFQYIPEIINQSGLEINYEIGDNDILIRDDVWCEFYRADGYKFCNREDLTNHPKNSISVIREQLEPGIFRRVTWGHIKKHFNLK